MPENLRIYDEHVATHNIKRVGLRYKLLEQVFSCFWHNAFANAFQVTFETSQRLLLTSDIESKRRPIKIGHKNLCTNTHHLEEYISNACERQPIKNQRYPASLRHWNFALETREFQQQKSKTVNKRHKKFWDRHAPRQLENFKLTEKKTEED